jgi:hypothetical protein
MTKNVVLILVRGLEEKEGNEVSESATTESKALILDLLQFSQLEGRKLVSMELSAHIRFAVKITHDWHLRVLVIPSQLCVCRELRSARRERLCNARQLVP